ncbi:hypothetical protein ACYX34_17410 [Nitrospira sp. CMX1]|nr:hypothetical protein [Nitrospira sp.]
MAHHSLTQPAGNQRGSYAISAEYSIANTEERHGFFWYSCSMQHRWIIVWLVWLPVLSTGGALAMAADSQQVDRNKGLTVEDLTRGLRSAAKNIEKEIPKIGPAIGATIKSVGRGTSNKTPSQNPPSDTR